VKSPGPIETPALPTRDIGLRLEVFDMKTMPERSNLHLVIRIEDPPTTERLTFIPEQVLIRLRDGKTLRLQGASPVTLFTPKLPTTPSIQWLAPGDGAGGDGRRELVAWVRADDRRAMRGGVSSVVVEGTVIPYAPRILATLPLEKGASAARDGVRVEICAVGHGLTDTTVALRETSVQVGDHPALRRISLMAGRSRFRALNEPRRSEGAIQTRVSPARWILGATRYRPARRDDAVQNNPRGEYNISPGARGRRVDARRDAHRCRMGRAWPLPVRVETSVP
jgi:hypothetical protein